MTQINHIRDWYRDGMSIRAIAQKMSMDRKTVRKYINMPSFSPEQPTTRPHESKLDPFKEFIETALENDRSVWEKQRHTATRLHNRLKEEFATEYTCSYPLVQRYVREYRKKLGIGAEAFNELEWRPGEAQVDFFDVDIDTRDGRLRKYMLALSFPYSNAAYHQLFSGVTAECVTQGLKDIFTHIGGVPSRLVFDNATGVGKQIKSEIHLTELFSRFRAHYGFDVSFCNPDSGHEKGNVENKGGYTRRNRFVPVPFVPDLQVFNKHVLHEDEEDFSRDHYKKQVPIETLHIEDKKSLHHLPSHPFDCCRYDYVMTDKYGKFVLNGCHHYSSSPEQRRSEVLVRIEAHHVIVMERDGTQLAAHSRQFGDKRTDTTDALTMVSLLVNKPGAWRNSVLRKELPDSLLETMDTLDQAGLRDAFKTMNELTRAYDFNTAVSSMEEAAKSGCLDHSSSIVLARRIATLGLDAPPLPGPDMRRYDALIYPQEGGADHDRVS